MISHIYSVAVCGLDGVIIDIESDIQNGLPSFTIVGLADASIQESRERVRSAIKNSNLPFPKSKITINLAPADIRKSGPSFDLPIAISLLSSEFEFSGDFIQKSVFLWELSLEWNIRSVQGVLPAVLAAKEKGFEYIFLPHESVYETQGIVGIQIIPCQCLSDVLAFLSKSLALPTPTFSGLLEESGEESFPDFSSIVGQQFAKRALIIGAAGGHNILMEWPPGAGKSMLAKALLGILPPLSFDEMIDVSRIYSVAGLAGISKRVTRRPFRSIHHTASSAALIGGGRDSRPGEISLAHRGVLFLDEILEFSKSVLETLRQPLEDGCIRVSRVESSYVYPARFMLVGAFNPCPCGFYGDTKRPCICSAGQIQKYRSKLSGPLLDRIDLFVRVSRVEAKDITLDSQIAELSPHISSQVSFVRDIQKRRFSDNWNRLTNAEMNEKSLRKFCKLSSQNETLLHEAVEKFQLSTRAYFRILRVARTIADLEWKNDIGEAHILEAISFRPRNIQE